MYVCLGTFPIQLARQMRHYFKKERKKRMNSPRFAYNNGKTIFTKYDLVFRGRGPRKGLATNWQNDLPIKKASKVALYVQIEGRDYDE